MFKRKQWQKMTVWGFMYLFALACLQVSAPRAQAEDKLLDTLPAESLFCVRINNLGEGLPGLDQFLMGIAPMQVSFLVQMQLMQMLGNPEPVGVDMNGDFAAFGGMVPGAAQENPLTNMFIGILIPVTDYQQFIKGNPNCIDPDAQGISRLQSIEGVQFGYLKQVGEFALFGPDWMNAPEQTQTNLSAMAKLMSAGQTARLASVIDADETQTATQKPLWLFGNVQEANKAFGPLVQQQIDMIKGQLVSEMAAAGSPMADPAAIIEMYANVFQGLVKNSKYLSIAVNPEPTALNLTVNLAALPEGELGQMLAGKPAGQRSKRLMGFLENGAMMNFEGRIDTPFVKQMLSKSMNLISALSGEETDPEQMKAVQNQLNTMFEAMGGSLAFSFATSAGTKPPFVIKEVFDVKDVQAYNESLEQQLEMFKTGALADMYKGMGMSIDYELQRGVGEHKGVTIDSAKLTFKTLDPDAPEAMVIDAMYGDGLEYHWGIVDDLCVMAIAGDSDKAVREMIDQVRLAAARPISSEMFAALESLPSSSEADFVGTFNAVRMMQLVGLMLQGMPELGAPDFPTVIAPSKSNLGYAGKMGAGKMSMEINLPKNHITEIMMIFMGNR